MKKLASKFHKAATACILLVFSTLLIVGTFVSGRVFMSVVTCNNNDMVSPIYDVELGRSRHFDDHELDDNDPDEDQNEADDRSDDLDL